MIHAEIYEHKKMVQIVMLRLPVRDFFVAMIPGGSSVI